MEEGIRSKTVNSCYDVHLPEEIIANIISRLPSKTLLRLLCVCKSWYSLITNDNFRTLHLSNFNLENNLDSPAWFSYNPYFTRCNPNMLSSSENGFDYLFWLHGRSFATWNPLPFPSHEISKDFGDALIVGSCNGVVCVLLSFSGSKEPCIELYNPSIRRYNTIKFLEATGPLAYAWRDDAELMHLRKSSPYVLGFGFVERSNDYKVVMICGGGFLNKSVIVYSLKKGSWVEIGVNLWGSSVGYVCSVWKTSLGTYHKGACHWVCVMEDTNIMILRFSLDEGKFQYIKPPGSGAANDTKSHFGVFVYENVLALSIIGYNLGDYCWEVWLMQKENAAASDTWTLLFRDEIEMMYVPPIVLKSDSDDKILLLRDGKDCDLLAYDPKCKEFGNLKLPDTTDQLIQYRGSLVLL